MASDACRCGRLHLSTREHFRDAGTRAYYDAHGSTHSRGA